MFLVYLLVDSFDDIFLKFIKARSKLVEAFTKETCHANKCFSDFLRYCFTKTGLELGYHGRDHLSNVLLVG